MKKQSVLLPDDAWTKVDAFGKSMKVGRSEAVRVLVERALAMPGFGPGDGPMLRAVQVPVSATVAISVDFASVDLATAKLEVGQVIEPFVGHGIAVIPGEARQGDVLVRYVKVDGETAFSVCLFGEVPDVIVGQEDAVKGAVEKVVHLLGIK